MPIDTISEESGSRAFEWVAYEYAKVRRLYDKLAIGDRTAIEFFNGPHTINGAGTFEFLHRHLNWPKPPVTAAGFAATKITLEVSR